MQGRSHRAKVGKAKLSAAIQQTRELLEPAGLPKDYLIGIVPASDTGAVEMAGLGPFALFWVGLSTFFMQVKNGGFLTSANWTVWIYGPIYFVVNILLIVMHYHLSAPIQAWIKIAPLLPNVID